MKIKYNAKGKWIAQTKVNNKEIHIGWFNTESEAAKAYDEFKIKNTSKENLPFLRLNFSTTIKAEEIKRIIGNK